jgi:hypothetical protein
MNARRIATMRVDEPLFRLWIKPGLSAEEYQQAAGAICRHLVVRRNRLVIATLLPSGRR